MRSHGIGRRGRLAGPAARRARFGTVAALLTLPFAAAACDDAAQDRNGPATATLVAPDFDSAAAFQLLARQVRFGPRVPGTEAHAAQLQWMLEYLSERADTVLPQPFTHVTAGGDTLRLTNVLARFRPDAEERVLLLAHWDTRSIAEMDPDSTRRGEPIPGANDGASGVALLLQLAEMFAHDAPPIGVDILLVDGEDYAPDEMYLGARHFAANQPAGYPPLYAVLVDMIADDEPRYPIEGYSAEYAPEVVQRVWSTAERLGYGSMFPRTVGGTILDDHVPLNEAGIRTIDIIDFEFGPDNRLWHTHADTITAVSARGLEAVGSVLAALVYSGG